MHIGLLFFSLSANALPCHYYSQNQLKSMPEDERGAYLLTCVHPMDAGKGAAASTQARMAGADRMRWDIEHEVIQRSFWDDWQAQNGDPLLKDNSSSAFYGLGLWMPKKYEDLDILTFEDAKEWVRKHGLLMSVGLGANDGASAKYRLDYMWHEDEQDGVMFQIEIPIQ
ncbi:hypothetical protein [Photobacterium sp. 1_MG-2023]|uniref:hypothetical protein n=1 Tax=Photobacterium sp. 1_MG-2023 TaxID=3062646 RepID=UPI0026E4192D|nr:hypothetical protein [Photobacterium sp. 1_MG-2023]MDO6706991.1 hypothetical protein [Photobacterium sp. 1_MG-2023]